MKDVIKVFYRIEYFIYHYFAQYYQTCTDGMILRLFSYSFDIFCNCSNPRIDVPQWYSEPQPQCILFIRIATVCQTTNSVAGCLFEFFEVYFQCQHYLFSV